MRGSARGFLCTDKGGFTLIEMILVVVLVSIMTSIIAPMWRLSPAQRVENAAYTIATELELARSEALSARRLVRVVFDVGAGTYAAFEDHDEDGTIGGTADELAAFPAFGLRTLHSQVTFGRGSASAVPGDAGVGAVTLASNQLDLSVQGVPTPWGTMGTIYLVSSLDSDAVSAISVASSGSFKAWRWYPDEGEWR
jgi:type II secretion system protein H